MTPPLNVQPTTARCPACGELLHQLVEGEGVAAGCMQCGGIWIDHDAARLVLAGTRDLEVRRFAVEIGQAAAAASASRQPAAIGARKCPVCGEGLRALPHGARRLIIDSCDRHGTFFDVRELDTIGADAEVKAAADDADAKAFGKQLDADRLQGLLDGIFGKRHRYG